MVILWMKTAHRHTRTPEQYAQINKTVVAQENCVLIPHVERIFKWLIFTVRRFMCGWYHTIRLSLPGTSYSSTSPSHHHAGPELSIDTRWILPIGLRNESNQPLKNEHRVSTDQRSNYIQNVQHFLKWNRCVCLCAGCACTLFHRHRLRHFSSKFRKHWINFSLSLVNQSIACGDTRYAWKEHARGKMTHEKSLLPARKLEFGTVFMLCRCDWMFFLLLRLLFLFRSHDDDE